MYANGEVPTNLLVTRPCAGKDLCVMMPGTAAKFDRLVALGQAEHGWTPVVSGAADGYRTIGMQWSYWNTLPYPQAAYPGTSSHGGTYDGRESGAVDIGNWGDVGQDVFFDLARRAGFQPGYFDGTAGKPLEQWHIIDWSPWDVPAPTPTPVPILSEEDIMPAPIINVVDRNGAIAANGTVYIGRDDGEFEPLDKPYFQNERGIISKAFFGGDGGSDLIPTLSAPDFEAVKVVWRQMRRGRVGDAPKA